MERSAALRRMMVERIQKAWCRPPPVCPWNEGGALYSYTPYWWRRTGDNILRDPGEIFWSLDVLQDFTDFSWSDRQNKLLWELIISIRSDRLQLVEVDPETIMTLATMRVAEGLRRPFYLPNISTVCQFVYRTVKTNPNIMNCTLYRVQYSVCYALGMIENFSSDF